MLNNIFLSLISISFKSIIIIFVIILVRELVKRVSYRYSYLLWLLLFLRLLPISFPQSSISAFNLANNTIINQDVSTINYRFIDYNLFNLLSYTWLLVLLFLMIKTLKQVIEVSKIKTSSKKIEDNIFEFNNNISPFVFGLINPAILIPSSLTKQEKDIVIKHERIHIRRKDYLFKLIGYLLLCIYWFNPFMWVAYYLFEIDMEYSCDEIAINQYNIDRVQYSNALFSVAKSSVPNIVFFNSVNLKNRIKRVIENKKTIKPLAYISIVLIVVVFSIFLTNNKYNISNLDFRMPVKYPMVLCNNCYDGHNGVDIMDMLNRKDAEVYSSYKGIISNIDFDADSGYSISVKHDNNTETIYSNLSEVYVDIGDKVDNDVLGKVLPHYGYESSHVHFELKYQGKNLDACQYLNCEK